MDWAGAQYETNFFEKCLFLVGLTTDHSWLTTDHSWLTTDHLWLTTDHSWLTRDHHGSPQITQQVAIFEYFGGVLEKVTFAENLKKCEDENDADGI